MEISYCEHLSRNLDGTCLDCGSSDGIYGGVCKTSIHNQTRKEKSLMKSLDEYNLPDDVKRIANELYQKSNIGTKRENNRKLLIAFLVREAYKELQIMITDKDLAEILHMSSKDMPKARTMYTFTRTGIRSSDVMRHPCDFLDSYCQKLHLSDEAQAAISHIIVTAMEKRPAFKDEKPQKITIGAIKYYIMENGIGIDNGELKTVSELSVPTINQIHNQIARVINAM